MKKLFSLFSLLVCLGISTNLAWGASTATITFADEGLTNQQQYTAPFDIDNNVTITFGGGANDGKYYTTGSGIRTYGGGTITIAAASGTITKAVFTWDGSNKPSANNANVGTYSTSNSTWTGSTTSFTLTRPSGSGHWRLQSVTVTYSIGGSTVAVESVALNEDEITLEVGESQTLTATITPNNATNQNVTWASDDETVATVASGLVTAVGAGTATITCKSEADNTISATCEVTVTAAQTPTLTFDFSAQNYENGVQYTSIEADANITISFGDGANDGKYYDTGTAIRVYGGGHMTVAGKEGVTISKVVLEFGSGDGSNTISTAVGTYNNGKWTGSAQSVTFNVEGTSGNRRIKVVKVFYEAVAVAVAQPTISGETSFLSSTEVTITQADADAIYYTTNDDDPTTESTQYTEPFSLTESATVKAIAVKDGVSSAVAELDFTKITVMTVAEARAAIDAGGDLTNKYVAGTISQIDSYSSQYHSIYYWISDDGTTTNQLEVYSGKGLNGADFAGISDLSLGDEVIVKGTLKKYNSTYEFDVNSQILQLNRTIAAPTFTPDGGGFLNTLSVSIASATDGAQIRYTVDESDPTSTSTLYENPIELSVTTTIKAAAFKDEFESVIVTKTFTKGTKITVAEALAALDSSSPIANQFVYGKVSTAPTFNPSNGKLTYYISDDGTTTDQLEVYNGFGLNGAAFEAKTDLQVGDEVTVYGTLKVYNNDKEFDSNNYLLEFNRPDVAVTSVSLPATASVEVGSTVTLTATVLPENATNKAITWSVTSGSNFASVADGVVTGIAAGEAVIRAASTADNTKYAECAVTVSEAAQDTRKIAQDIDGFDAISGNLNADISYTSNKGDGTADPTLKEGSILYYQPGSGKASGGYMTITAVNGCKIDQVKVVTATNATSIKYSKDGGNLSEATNVEAEDDYLTPASLNAQTVNIYCAGADKNHRLYLAQVVVYYTGESATVDHLVLSGEYQTEFMQGDEFNYTGLVVEAAYDAQGNEMVDVTAQAEVTAPDMSTAGQKTVTVSFGEKEATYTINVAANAEIDDLSGTWMLVTGAAQLEAGKKVIIAGITTGAIVDVKTMGKQNTNNRAAVNSAIAEMNGITILTPSTGTKVFTLVDAGEGKFAFRASNSKYLCAASSSSNNLKEQEENNANGQWIINIDENSLATITAQGNYTRNTMRYNPNNGNPLFACYASNSTTGSLVALFVLQEDEPDDPDPVYTFEEVRSGLEIGRHYTACLKKKIVAVQGATIWGLSQSNSDKTVAYLVEETLPLPAGAPFIYQATDATFKAAYEGDEGDEADEPIERGALRGTFEDMNAAALDEIEGDVYMMYQNTFRPLGTNNHLDAFRAYLLRNALQPVNEAPQPAPGRRVKGMTMQGNVTTDIEDAEASAKPMKKLIDGQLFILCGEKLYDATGRQVK